MLSYHCPGIKVMTRHSVSPKSNGGLSSPNIAPTALIFGSFNSAVRITKRSPSK